MHVKNHQICIGKTDIQREIFTHIIFIREATGFQLWENQLSIDLDLKAPWKRETEDLTMYAHIHMFA